MQSHDPLLFTGHYMTLTVLTNLQELTLLSLPLLLHY